MKKNRLLIVALLVVLAIAASLSAGFYIGNKKKKSMSVEASKSEIELSPEEKRVKYLSFIYDHNSYLGHLASISDLEYRGELPNSQSIEKQNFANKLKICWSFYNYIGRPNTYKLGYAMHDIGDFSYSG